MLRLCRAEILLWILGAAHWACVGEISSPPDAGSDEDGTNGQHDEGGGSQDSEANAEEESNITDETTIPKPARVWDLGKKYGPDLNMGFVGWEDRAQWQEIPYGTTPARVENDVALEGPRFYFNITWRPDSYISGPVLYRKPDPSDTEIPRHNLLYRGWFTPTGLWAGGGNLGWIKVVKNTPEEIVVESAGLESNRDPQATAQVVANYGVRAGKPWLEITPVSQCSTIGMHGESRFAICPEAEPDGSDYVYDALPLRAEPDGRDSVHGKMLLDFVMDDDNLWALMPTPAAPDSDTDSNRMPLEYRVQRFMLSVQVEGYHAGWSKIGEGPCQQVVSAPYAFFLGQKIVIGHLRVGYWHYQKIGAEVQQGADFRIGWKYGYEGTVAGSPFTTGGPWWPSYPGKWRMINRISGNYYVTPLDIQPADVGKTEITYKPPASGTLEYVLLYLYDRNDATPAELYTPMDIYREAILGEPRGG